MGKTKRRNPFAKELEKPQYRGRKMKDKRKAKLEEQLAKEPLNDEEFKGMVICIFCGLDVESCRCPERKGA